MSLRRDFLIDNLDLPAASGVDDAKWEYFQLCLWADESTYSIDNKSRQIAFSFACAADAIASMILEERDSVFVSINKDEAQEKIRYAKDVYDNLLIGGKPSIERDTMGEIEFSNGVRITSFPSRPVRGRPRINLYLDEFAHMAKDRQIYSGSIPAIVKGGGRVRAGSSPMGASGLFWEVYEQKIQKWPGFKRRETPWWEIYAFCTNVKEARKLAPSMPTHERVDMFGNDRIQSIYANMVEEDFQQEFECLFVDEVTAWITWDEIRNAQTEKLTFFQSESVGTLNPDVLQSIFDLAEAVRFGQVEPAFSAGVDIGRTKNTTEIYLTGISTTGSLPIRLMITLDGIKFEDQLEVVLAVIEHLPVVIMLVDQNGIGRNLAENAQSAHPFIVQPVDFTNASKIVWATDAKTLIQSRKTPLPIDRELAYQIHSIKKIITASNNVVFDTTTNEKHHADKFWAWALALHGGYQRPPVAPQSVRVVHDEAVSISPY